MKLDSVTYKFTDSGTFGSRALAVGVIGLAASFGGYFMDSGQFYHSYLTAFVFWVTLGLGGLFFTMLNHLVAAEWSIVLRRMSESVMTTLPLMAIMFLPIIFGMHDLFHWADAEAVATDTLLQVKEPYLNFTFFFIRTAGYFAVWYFLSRALYRLSMKQDSAPNDSLNTRMRQISGPGMVLFAITLTFAAFDWLMSLSPHWYSTIFGVYVFVGSFLAALSFLILMSFYLRGKGVLSDKITVEHYHDLGKLLFAFTVFWAYIAFSQYFLIWYGNMPEETFWYLARWEGSWKYVSMLLIVGHFCLPFLVLIPRSSKRSMKVLGFMASWMLFIHFVDLYWIISPSFGSHAEGAVLGFHFSWMDITTMAGVGGVFLWLFWKKYTSTHVVPVNDRKLEASFNFINS